MSNEQKEVRQPKARKSTGSRTRRAPATAGAQGNYKPLRCERQERTYKAMKMQRKPSTIGNEILLQAFNDCIDRLDVEKDRNNATYKYIMDYYNAQQGGILDGMVTGFLLGFSSGMRFSELLADESLTMKEVLDRLLDRKGADHDVQ